MSLDWSQLLRALALVMVIEGLMPFAAPSRWRNMLMAVSQWRDGGVRMMGLVSMALGLLLLYLA